MNGSSPITGLRVQVWLIGPRYSLGEHKKTHSALDARAGLKDPPCPQRREKAAFRRLNRLGTPETASALLKRRDIHISRGCPQYFKYRSELAALTANTGDKGKNSKKEGGSKFNHVELCASDLRGRGKSGEEWCEY